MGVTTMYVDRNEGGRIVGAWEDPQRTGQELVPLDGADLHEFLALPVGRFDVPAPDGARWRVTLRGAPGACQCPPSVLASAAGPR